MAKKKKETILTHETPPEGFTTVDCSNITAPMNRFQ